MDCSESPWWWAICKNTVAWRACTSGDKSCHCAPAARLMSEKRPPAHAVTYRRARRLHRPYTTPSCSAASIRRPASPYRIHLQPCCWCRDSGKVELACSPFHSRKVARGPVIARIATRTSARRRTTASARSWLAHHPRVHAGQGQTLALIERVNRSQGPALPSTACHGSREAWPSRFRPHSARTVPPAPAALAPRNDSSRLPAANNTAARKDKNME